MKTSTMIAAPLAAWLLWDTASFWLPTDRYIPIVSWFRREWRKNPQSQATHTAVFSDLLIFAIIVYQLIADKDDPNAIRLATKGERGRIETGMEKMMQADMEGHGKCTETLLTKMVAKYWCKVCKVWVHDNVAMRTSHEKTQKHKDAMTEFLGEQFEASAKRKKEQDDVAKELARINEAAALAHAGVQAEPTTKRRKLLEEAPAVPGPPKAAYASVAPFQPARPSGPAGAINLAARRQQQKQPQAKPSAPAKPPAKKPASTGAPAFGAPEAAPVVRELPPPPSAADLARMRGRGAGDEDGDSDDSSSSDFPPPPPPPQSEQAPAPAAPTQRAPSSVGFGAPAPAAPAAAPRPGACGFGAPASSAEAGERTSSKWSTVSVTKVDAEAVAAAAARDDDVDSDEERYGKPLAGKPTLRTALPCGEEDAEARLRAADEKLHAARGGGGTPAAEAVSDAAAAPAVAFRKRKKPVVEDPYDDPPAAPGGESVATTFTKVGRNGRARNFRRKVDE